ncbi:MAG: hypothetical protein GXY67_03510 [Clostridiales bacterium]|nr:hypothetical protein [Clostridiales bacterium]
MNCPKCGSLLLPGAQFCNVCNEPISSNGYQPYGQQPSFVQTTQPLQGYGPVGQPPLPGFGAGGYPPTQGNIYPGGQPGQQPGYQQGFQQSYAQYTNPQCYPTDYNSYCGTMPDRRDADTFLTAQFRLPGMLRDCFRDPGSVLQGIMERRDWYTTPVVAGLTLLFTFLCGMFFATGMVQIFFGFFTAVTGYAMAGDAVSLSQGVSYVSGKIGTSVGGIAVLCQLFAMLLPLIVMLVYLCAVSKVRFSWELVFGCFTVTTLPTVAVSLLALLAALAVPSLPVVVALLGTVVSYVVMGSLLGRVTGKPEQALVLPKIVCICVSLLLTLLFLVLVGGTLMNGVVQSTMTLLGNLTSLL